MIASAINKKLFLSKITLIGIDDNFDSLKKAALVSCADCWFPDVRLLSCKSDEERDVIGKIGSKRAYSNFVFKELAKYIETDFIVLFQADGFIVNWKAWTDDFLQYDYIGAVWNFLDTNQVGNGGFSLRSKRLQDILMNDHNIILKNGAHTKDFAEDYNIGFIYRDYLERNYGIKFAPPEVCKMFSIEAWDLSSKKKKYRGYTPENKYSGSFGFHGYNIDFNDSDIPMKPYQYPNRNKKIEIFA